MKTSYFNKLLNEQVAGVVSITVGRPTHVHIYYELELLAPPWWLFTGFRRGTITEARYTTRFNAELAKLNPHRIVKKLESMTGDAEPVMMCHGGDGDFCHRHLVAEWLTRETGIVIEEYGTGLVNRKDGRIIY